jgi:deoxyribodipyrimidine photo-lyase
MLRPVSAQAVRAVVWFKRDLRVRDHAPLAAAAAADNALALHVVEPAWLDSPECHPRQVAWTLAALGELRAALAARGLPLVVRVGPVPAVFDALRRDFAFTHLFSHEETGPLWTYDRDRAVAAWCRERGVAWHEFAHTGVVRRLRSRNGWAQQWQRRMDAPEVAMPACWRGAPVRVDALPTLRDLGLPSVEPPAGAGERAAWTTLESFLAARGRGYRRHLSSPLAAAEGCSRLSEHLAFGTVSMRCLHQATTARIDTLAGGDADERRFAHDLRGFAGRLRWHCHFVQKLEDEPAIEHRNFARACDGLRPGDGVECDAQAQRRFDAWREGRTGYPMVDACMRSLVATGWLNFRMRAMLVSFASYHLWLHWRPTGLHLARQFLDFEPGIHWSQMQMQSGTTGINTLRIYSPTKQALDHDPDGAFIRRWVSELEGVPAAFVAQPWRMPADVQKRAGCVIGRGYPPPIVDDRTAVRQAKDRLYALRATREARAEADDIQHRHGSRKSGLPPTTKPRVRGRAPKADAAAQRSLFDEVAP